MHEALLERWPRLARWLEEDAQGRRLHRHLTQAATDWDAAGREPSELYRGARLAAALEWADAGGEAAGLNRLEREFLEESRTAFARANRRLRALLARRWPAPRRRARRGRGRARGARLRERQATAAIAQRLGAQALVEPQLDRALLLAREGVALDDSAATRSNLLAALLRSPAALAVLHGGGTRVLDDALGPDGRTLAVRGDDGSVTFFDTRTLRELGPRFQRAARSSTAARSCARSGRSRSARTADARRRRQRRAPRDARARRHPHRQRVVHSHRHAHGRRPRTSRSPPTAARS